MTIQRSLAAAVVGGALVLGLAACGSSGNSSAAPAAPAPSSNANRGAQARGPAASGTIAAVTASNMEVQNASGQVTVNFGGDTTFTDRVAATLADVTQGSCVVVTGTGQPLVAQTVEISAATANGCAPGGFGGGARPQNGNGGQAPRSRPPRPSGAGNGGNQFRPAFGKVTAVTPTGFTVEQDNRQTGATTDVQVSVDGSTTYSKTQSADSTALKVGECVAANGTTDDTGSVTAKTISISQPGPNGCTPGARQRPGTGNPGGNGNG